MRTHKGICENFALLFTEICNQLGIESYSVEGYTRQKEFTDYIPHVWSAAKLGEAWYLFDPTWGSGYILNKKFVRKINNEYYKVPPARLIRTHMRFDYLWQFLDYPVTASQFYEGTASQDKTQPYFNFKDSIQFYNNQNRQDQLQSAAYRIEKNGIKNSMIYDRLHHIKIELENFKIKKHNENQQRAVDDINNLTNRYNDGIQLINKYIDYKNHQFTPLKPDAEIKAMYDTAARIFADIEAKLNSVDENFLNVASAKKQLQQFLTT